MISLNTNNVQRSKCYELSMTILKSKSNWRVGPGCDTFDFVERRVHSNSHNITTKFKIFVKLMCNYCQGKI